MPNPQWVISKYAPKTGEKFEVAEIFNDRYIVYKDKTYYSFIKSEYIPTTPPERWEEVPIEGEGRGMVLRAVAELCSDAEQFIIQDGKLVLQRRVA